MVVRRVGLAETEWLAKLLLCVISRPMLYHTRNRYSTRTCPVRQEAKKFLDIPMKTMLLYMSPGVIGIPTGYRYKMEGM